MIFLRQILLLLAVTCWINVEQSVQVSQWDPFCQEKILYKPYLNIWVGGKSKMLDRSRGPGFINVMNKKDIYVCVNGIVFFYYVKTSAMGEVYEEGELEWAPHHCQLYNPSHGAGRPDHPVKNLKSILLIGHPTDFRNPALQMFIAPYYDLGDASLPPPNRAAAGYVNLTSLLVVNTEGECIVEKGIEGAQIRVQANLPDFTYEPEENETMPTTFCRLNSRYFMGQFEEEFAFLDDNNVRPRDSHDAERMDYLPLLFADHELKFKGCFRYPLSSEDQLNMVIRDKARFTEPILKTVENDNNLNPSGTASAGGKPAKFWGGIVRGKMRYERGEYSGITNLEPDKTENELQKEWEAKWMVLQTMIKYGNASKSEFETAEEEEYVAYVNYHFLPFYYEYYRRYENIRTIGQTMQIKWQIAVDNIDDKMNIRETLNEYLKVAREVPEIEADLRNDAYNWNLVQKYKDKLKEVEYRERVLRRASVKFGRHVSMAESWTATYFRYLKAFKTIVDKTQAAIVNIEKRRPVRFVRSEKPVPDGIISIVNLNDDGDRTSCDYLPKAEATCSTVKPTAERACLLYKNRMGKGSDWKRYEDSWRDRVLELIASIFSKVCPYVGQDMGEGVSRVVKGYLNNEPNGTGLPGPVNGTITAFNAMDYVAGIYNESAIELGDKRPFWDQLIDSLEVCLGKVSPLEFFSQTDSSSGDDKERLMFRKRFVNNDTVKEVDVEELRMEEQAEREFRLNWAIDTSWKMFATVLGSCMPHYETRIPHISFRLYAMYNEDFLHPIRQTWMSNRDNPVFSQIFGKFMNSEKWIDACMESSFLAGGDATYRPLRWLYVNSFSQLNFFVSGPFVGSSGVYFL